MHLLNENTFMQFSMMSVPKVQLTISQLELR